MANINRRYGHIHRSKGYIPINSEQDPKKNISFEGVYTNTIGQTGTDPEQRLSITHAGGVELDPLYVDNIYEKTPGAPGIRIHSPVVLESDVLVRGNAQFNGMTTILNSANISSKDRYPVFNKDYSSSTGINSGFISVRSAESSFDVNTFVAPVPGTSNGTCMSVGFTPYATGDLVQIYSEDPSAVSNIFGIYEVHARSGTTLTIRGGLTPAQEAFSQTLWTDPTISAKICRVRIHGVELNSDGTIAHLSMSTGNLSSLSRNVVANIAGSQTLTNKTMTANSNNITARALFTNNGSNTVSTYAAANPTAGQVLTATGASTATWQTPEVSAAAAATLQNKSLIDNSTFIIDDVDASKRIRFEVGGVSASTTRVLTAPDADLTIVGTDTDQYITNKQIDVQSTTFTHMGGGPAGGFNFVLAGSTNRAITVPSQNFAMVGDVVSQTLSNKSLADQTTHIINTIDASKRAKFEVSGITTGATRTMTVPDANITLVGTDNVQTLTNKTLTSPTINNATLSIDDPTASSLSIASNSGLTANRSLTLNVKDANRTISLGGNLETNYLVRFEGTGTAVFNANGASSLQLPNSGTLATKSGDEIFFNKKLVDSSTQIIDQLDLNKGFQFDVENVSAGTIRTLSVPDASGTLVLNDNAATLSNKTFSSNILAAANNSQSIGATATRFAETFTDRLRVGSNQTTNAPGRVAITGTNTSATAGPFMNFYTNSDAFPLYQILPFGHNGSIWNMFDAYYDTDAVFKGSHNSPAYAFQKHSNVFDFNTAPAGTAGSAITWTNRARLNTTGFDFIDMSAPASGFRWNNGANRTILRAIGATAERTIELPNDSGTVLLTTTSQNISNKNLVDSSTFIVDDVDATKRLQFQCSGISTGTTRTLTVPNASTTIVGDNATQTLSNKTFSNNIAFSTDNTVNIGSLSQRAAEVFTDRFYLGPNSAITAPTKFNMVGTADNLASGPHINVYHTGNTHPVAQYLHWGGDNIITSYGTYWNGSGWRNTNTSASYQIQKLNGLLNFNTLPAGVAGGVSGTITTQAQLGTAGFNYVNMARLGWLQYEGTGSGYCRIAGPGSVSEQLTYTIPYNTLPNPNFTLSNTATTTKTASGAIPAITFNFKFERQGSIVHCYIDTSVVQACTSTNWINIIDAVPLNYRPAVSCSAGHIIDSNSVAMMVTVIDTGLLRLSRLNGSVYEQFNAFHTLGTLKANVSWMI